MGKLIIITITITLCSMVIAMPIVEAAIAKDPESVSNWFLKLSTRKEKLTKFHFYLHDVVSGNNPTAKVVAGPNFTDSSPTVFGLVAVIDDPLTVGPEPDSKIVGRAQGIYASAAMTDDIALLLTINIVFTEGTYNGSTLSILGRNQILDTYRELPIIGGSGVFRLARGVATAKSVMFNTTSGDAIVEYHVIVLHY